MFVPVGNVCLSFDIHTPTWREKYPCCVGDVFLMPGIRCLKPCDAFVWSTALRSESSWVSKYVSVIVPYFRTGCRLRLWVFASMWEAVVRTWDQQDEESYIFGYMVKWGCSCAQLTAIVNDKANIFLDFWHILGWKCHGEVRVGNCLTLLETLGVLFRGPLHWQAGNSRICHYYQFQLSAKLLCDKVHC